MLSDADDHIAAILTFLVGALIYWQQLQNALAIAVTIGILLASKPFVHRWANNLTNEDILSLLRSFTDGETRKRQKDGQDEEVIVSRIFPTTNFGFRKITVERPLRLNFQASPERIARLVILNTAAFHLPAGKQLPLALKICRDTRLGAFLVLKMNLFALKAARVGCKRKPMSAALRGAYCAPYGTPSERIATLRFVQVTVELTEARVRQVDEDVSHDPIRPG